MKKYTAAIIGLGNIGYKFQEYKVGFATTHFEAYIKNNRVDLVSVCDTDEAQVTKVARQYGLAGFGDYKEMLKRTAPSFVSICSPDETHYQVLKDILDFDSVKAVWCEKPITLSLRQAKEVVSLYEEKKKVLLVNFIRRYDAFYEYIKDNLDSLVGEIKTVSVYYSGGLVTAGSHVADLLNYFFGDCVSARGRKAGNDVRGELEFGNGLHVNLIPMQTEYSILEMNIFGDRARLDTINRPFGEYNYRYFVAEKSNFSSAKFISKSEAKPIPENMPRRYMETALENLIECVESGKQPKSSGLSSLKSLEIILALWYCAKQDKKILFPFDKEEVVLPKSGGDARLWKN